MTPYVYLTPLNLPNHVFPVACAQGTTVRLAIEMYPYATLSTSLLLVFFGFRRRKAEPRVFRASGARGSAASRFLGVVVRTQVCFRQEQKRTKDQGGLPQRSRRGVVGRAVNIDPPCPSVTLRSKHNAVVCCAVTSPQNAPTSRQQRVERRAEDGSGDGWSSDQSLTQVPPPGAASSGTWECWKGRSIEFPGRAVYS